MLSMLLKLLWRASTSSTDCLVLCLCLAGRVENANGRKHSKFHFCHVFTFYLCHMKTWQLQFFAQKSAFVDFSTFCLARQNCKVITKNKWKHNTFCHTSVLWHPDFHFARQRGENKRNFCFVVSSCFNVWHPTKRKHYVKSATIINA